MERLLDLGFWIASLFDLHSSNPANAAMKRARLSVVLCVVAELMCFLAAFGLEPDAPIDSHPGILALVSQAQEAVAMLFVFAAIVFNLGMMWNAWMWYRAYSKPELYY
jgi:hypothetical protein